MGRKTVPDEKKIATPATAYLTLEEAKELKQNAVEQELTVSQLLRLLVLDELERRRKRKAV